MRPALFLDRDGVINFNYGYVHCKNMFKFQPGIFDLVAKAKAKGFICVVITNQSGIGRGLYSLEEFRALSVWMCEKFEAKNASIDAIYYSPYHPIEGKGKYLLEENTRKPGSGMFFEAAKDFNIDLSKSIMVGDSLTDMKASISANVGYNYLLDCHDNIRISDETPGSYDIISDFSSIKLERLC
jgi:D-glycero-D-manno-heptose 1,7-bisphosphate phosphatase